MNIIHRNTRLFVAGTAVLALFLAPQTGILIAHAAQSVGDKTVENPGLLPTNPFYFLKSFVRSTQRALTVNPVKRATLELDILNQKAGELKRLVEVLDGSDENVKAATVPYAESIDRLRVQLQSISDSSAKNAEVDKLLTNLLQTGISHMMIFDVLENASDIDMRDRLESLSSRFGGLIADTFSRLDTNDNFRNRLEQLAADKNGDPVAEMALVRNLVRIEEKLSDDTYLRDALLIGKEQLLFSAIAGMQKSSIPGVVPDLFDQLPGNILRTIVMLDEIRERVGDTMLKNTLAIVRQHLVDVSQDTKAVSKPEADKILAEANRLVRITSVRSTGVKSSAVTLSLSRAKFNATQADASFKIGQYGDAAWQASASIAAAKNAMTYLARNDKGVLNMEVRQLKSKYDSLIHIAEDNGVSQDNTPQILALFAQSEKMLAIASDLISGKINLDKAVFALRDADLSVERVEVALQELSRRIKEASTAMRASKALIERVLPSSDASEKQLKKEAIEEVQRASENQ